MAEEAGPTRLPLAALFGAEGDLDDFADAFAAPLYWPALPAERVRTEWEALAAWVGGLVLRFGYDSHVIPTCWWRHNCFVEALSALRDHERGSYAPTSPSTAAVEFHRALRDVEARLRAWAAELRCDGEHDHSHDRPADCAPRVSRSGWLPTHPGGARRPSTPPWPRGRAPRQARKSPPRSRRAKSPDGSKRRWRCRQLRRARPRPGGRPLRGRP